MKITSSCCFVSMETDRHTAALSVMSDALLSLSMDVVLCPSPPAEIWAQQSAVYYLSHVGAKE